MIMVTMLILRCSFHDVQDYFQLLVMRCFKFNKPSSTISYPLCHTQLVSIVTKKEKQKQNYQKRVQLTKTKLKIMLEYKRVKEKTKRVRKMKEKFTKLVMKTTSTLK